MAWALEHADGPKRRPKSLERANKRHAPRAEPVNGDDAAKSTRALGLEGVKAAQAGVDPPTLEALGASSRAQQPLSPMAAWLSRKGAWMDPPLP